MNNALFLKEQRVRLTAALMKGAIQRSRDIEHKDQRL